MFWDVDTVDIEKNASFVIGRVLNFGDTDDFRWALRVYGQEKIKEVIMKNKTLSAKSISFWCQYFHINPKQCTSKLLRKTPSAFSQR